jgi:phytoene desaturase
MPKKVVVIGSGFAGISAAANLAKAGFQVTVLEKNSQIGGRARSFAHDGFLFDMGPSWYWMPEVFENFFNSFGKSTSDYYELKRLDPSYKVFFGKNDFLDIPAKMDKLEDMFEGLEPGSSKYLKKFLKESKYKYEVGMGDLVHKPSKSLFEFVNLKVIGGVLKMHIFKSMSSYVKKYFKHPKLIQLLEFPVLFLGATPWKTPALYSLMNYADMALGTWYPMGGMHKIVEGMASVAKDQGVKFEVNSNVESIETEGRNVKGVIVNGQLIEADVVIGGADYHHVDQTLLPEKVRMYSDDYWQKREMAPSSLIFYLGLNKKVEGIEHHNLFFDQDFNKHAKEIYDTPKWPDNPLFYMCCPTKTDPAVAPKGKENIFILVPIAPGLQDEEEIREKYFDLIIDRITEICGVDISDSIEYKKSYALKDFSNDYNAFKGNAYGLANTLRQTAILKPAMKNKNLNNLFYTGQLTVPGPGVPPSIISGQVVANEISKEFKAV